MAKDKDTKPNSKMGRPVEPVPEDMVEEIVEWLSHGKTLREFCRQDGKPSWRLVYYWMEKDKDFFSRITHARDIGYDAIAEETLEIVDATPPNDINGRTDSGYVSWAKNRAEQRLKLLSKWSPKKYGDKVETTVKGDKDNPLTIETKLDDTQLSVLERFVTKAQRIVKDGK